MEKYDYLNALENDYQQAETAETGGRLPNGRYVAILNEARLYPPDEKKAIPAFPPVGSSPKAPTRGGTSICPSTSRPRASRTTRRSPKRGRRAGAPVHAAGSSPDFSGKIAQLTLAEQERPAYQRLFDRLLGTGNVRLPQAQTAAPAAAGARPQRLAEIDDEGDLPF